MTPSHPEEAPLVEIITDPADLTPAFAILAAAFGTQIHDAIWTGLHPAWDTPSGAAAGAQRLAQRWRATTRDPSGDPNTLFLKATLPAPSPQDPHHRVTAGFAIWEQASAVPGRGIAPSPDLGPIPGLQDGDDDRWVRQLFASLVRQRIAHVASRARQDPPTVFLLDICATDPRYQRRGVAGALVRFGLEEARRRGVPEATTEASAMGRHVYARCGFERFGEGEVVYEVDEKFRGRETPSNVFMRAKIAS
ncbi:hypothetical protein F5Y15DRAFT_426795 [Xylariaceae sp. FL0016]|nr:hypothetical protein F5Y15DRAFT_426795 [Xylariaceae sp. FL0016]